MVTTALNAVCLLALAAFIAVIARGPAGLKRLLSACQHPAAVGAIATMALAGLTVRVALGYFAPGDFAQEVVAAHHFEARGTSYSTDLSGDIRAWLSSEPPPHEWILPRRAQQYVDQLRHDLPSLYGPQAHPPLLLLALSPIVRLVGGYWAYLLVTLATLGAAVVGTGLVLRWARPDDWRAWWWLCIVAAWGWQPTLAAVRQGQVGVIVACLLLGAWSAIRSRRDFTAGLLVGLATALKVYPVVFLSLLITRPRSIAGALLVAIGAGILLFLVAGLSELEAYRQSALLVVQKYGDAHNNWSLWTLLGLVGLPARSRWFVATISAILISVTTFLRRKSDRGAGWTDDVIDLRSGAAMCLAVLLSPIAWQHYFFLLLLPLWASARWLMLRGETAGLAGWCVALLVVSLPDTPFWLLDEAVGHSRLALLVVSPTTAIILIWATCLVALRQGKAEVSAFIPRTTTASA